ncbi:MAG: DUF1887 family CARF protein [Deltaproteobacteria bacterium]|nr:DUF1887 family CARF protein [Deltaproteobacteria bacterium]
MKRIHICLVSEQPIPNMIPVFMNQFFPDWIILIYTREMKAQSQRLKNIFSKYNIEVSEILTDPFDYRATGRVIEKIRNVCSKDELILNITCGTKMMSLGAFEAFVKGDTSNHKVVYVDTINRKVKTIFPQTNAFEFENVIRFEDYLYSYGYKCSQYKKETNLILECGKIINDYIRSVLSCTTVRSSQQYFWQIFPRELYSKIMKEYNYGFWLEAFVYYMVFNFLQTEDNLRFNVVIKRSNDVSNELDVAFVYFNRLYIIECKTGTDSNVTYKLNSISNTMGRQFCKAMYVSTKTYSDIVLKRAEMSNIKYVHKDMILNFERILAEWVK